MWGGVGVREEQGVNERRPFLPFLIYTGTPLCAVRIRGKLVFRNFYESVEKKL